MLIILKKKKDFQQIVWSKNENNMKTKIVSVHIHLTDNEVNNRQCDGSTHNRHHLKQ